MLICPDPSAFRRRGAEEASGRGVWVAARVRKRVYDALRVLLSLWMACVRREGVSLERTAKLLASRCSANER